MSVSQRWQMIAMGVLNAWILLAVINATAGVDMREMVSSAQVTQPCKSSLVYLDIPAQISLQANQWACCNLNNILHLYVEWSRNNYK